jgi:hypothetical protein
MNGPFQNCKQENGGVLEMAYKMSVGIYSIDEFYELVNNTLQPKPSTCLT